MNVRLELFRAIAFLLFGLALGPPTLSASAAPAAAEPVGRIQNLWRESGRVREQAALTLEKLKRLWHEDRDLKTEFPDFKRTLKRLEDYGMAARSQVLAMEAGAPAYFQAWEDQVDTLKDPKVREKARKHYQERLKSYNEVIKALNVARDHLKLFLADLHQVQSKLEEDLKPATLKSERDLFKSAKKHGNDSIEALEEFETELKKASELILKYFE